MQQEYIFYYLRLKFLLTYTNESFMKKYMHLLTLAMLIACAIVFVRCDDSTSPIDESEPESPTLFEYVLTVLDEETSKPRVNESVTVKRTNKDGDVIHSTEECTTNEKGEVILNVRSGYYVAEVAFEPGKVRDNLFKFEIANHMLKSTMRVKDMNPDIEPHQVVITVINAKTNSAWASKSFELYSVTGENKIEKIDTYTTNDSGKGTMELVAGRYKVACAYFDGVSTMTNTADFTVKRDTPNTAEIKVEPVHFADDFSWVLPGWGETGDLALWYATIDPPAANSAATFELRWDLLTNADNITIRDSKGWTTPETLAGTARFVFFRPGIIKLGSASRGGAMTTPAFKNITGTVKLHFSFDSNPMHLVTNGAWALADKGNPLQMIVRVSGNGYFKDSEGKPVSELKLDNPSGLQADPQWPVDRWNKLEAVVYDATSTTQITIESNVLNGGSGSGCRSFLDNVVVKELY